jgi:hypothetical protein
MTVHLASTKIKIALGVFVFASVIAASGGSAAADQSSSSASSTAQTTSVAATPAPSPRISISAIPTSADWQKLSGAPTLANTSLVLVEGSTSSGVCTFQEQLTRSGATPIQEDEVAANDSLCQEVLQVGTPSADLISSEFGTTSTASSSASTASTTYGSAAAKAWYTDCCDITETSIKDSINWGYNGSCVVGSASGVETWYWETQPAAWHVDVITTPPEVSVTCSRARTLTSEYSAHGTFVGCTAYETYTNAYVSGHANGSATFGAGHSLTGCSFKFSYHDALV